MKPRNKRSRSERMRQRRRRMWKRQRGICAGCGEWVRFEDSTIDHNIPISMGGTHSPQNTQMMCRPCNQGKADESVWDSFDEKSNDMAAIRIEGDSKE